MQPPISSILPEISSAVQCSNNCHSKQMVPSCVRLEQAGYAITYGQQRTLRQNDTENSVQRKDLETAIRKVTMALMKTAVSFGATNKLMIMYTDI